MVALSATVAEDSNEEIVGRAVNIEAEVKVVQSLDDGAGSPEGVADSP